MNLFGAIIITVLIMSGSWSHINVEGQSAIQKVANIPDKTVNLPVIDSTPIPVKTGDELIPALTAASYIMIDTASGEIIASSNATQQRPIASLTKMVTAIVILSRHNGSDIVTIPELPAYPSDAEIMGLVPGDTMSVDDLIKAALIPSANDAADALAIFDSGSVEKFTQHMNDKMREWGIDGTHFASASGLSDENNYANAKALADIGRLAIINPTIAAASSSASAQITSGRGQIFSLKTTNQLLASGQFYGIKTGYTGAAGQCFVGLTQINGHQVITVVLGSDDRFGETLQLKNWIGRNYQWL